MSPHLTVFWVSQLNGAGINHWNGLKRLLNLILAFPTRVCLRMTVWTPHTLNTFNPPPDHRHRRPLASHLCTETTWKPACVLRKLALHSKHLNYKCYQSWGRRELSTRICFSHQHQWAYVGRTGEKDSRETGTAVCSYVSSCVSARVRVYPLKLDPPPSLKYPVAFGASFLLFLSIWLRALRQTLRTQSSQIQPTEIIKGLHAARNKGVCIFEVGRGQVFGVSGCRDASGWVQLVRKTGYCLTLPLTWLQYRWQWWGALGVSHPLADPPMDVHVYGGVLTNICPAQRDRQASWVWGGVYSYLALCTLPQAPLNTYDTFWGSMWAMTTIATNKVLYLDSS